MLYSTSGNQRQQRNAGSNRTADPLISPVTPAELANYLGLAYDSSDDSFLESFILSACVWYVAYSNNELLERDYTLKFDRYPQSSEGYSGLGIEPGILQGWIQIPVNPATDVTEILADGEDITADATIDYDSKPQRIKLPNRFLKAIEISYTAGYPTSDDIPANILHGIKMLAAYLYEHRGECDAQNAAQKSGAAGMFSTESMILNL